MQGLPRELLDLLRVTSIVRMTAADLGGTIHDRLRINATYALKVPFLCILLMQCLMLVSVF